MIKNIFFFFVFAALVAFEATAQTVGGFPSRPTFQALTVKPGGVSNATFVMDDATASPYLFTTGNAGDFSLRACSPSLGSCGNIINFPTRASDTAVTFIDFTANTAVRINGTNIEVPVSGTLSLQAQGCTTTPTATANWTRIGKMVVMRVPYLSCTSNTSTFRWDITAGSTTGIIPANNRTTFPAVFRDNSAAISDGAAEISNSPFNAFNFTRGGSDTAWTTSGNKAFGNSNSYEFVFTYLAL